MPPPNRTYINLPGETDPDQREVFVRRARVDILEVTPDRCRDVLKDAMQAGRDEREVWTATETIASVASTGGLYASGFALLAASSHGLGGAAIVGAGAITVMIVWNIVARLRSRGKAMVTPESLMERLRE